MNKLIITKCIECANWVPADSHGIGAYCDELGEVISKTETEIAIPDICPLLVTHQANTPDPIVPGLYCTVCGSNHFAFECDKEG